MTTRWPLHPAPVMDEALSSWLARIAVLYSATVEDLVADLGFWPGRVADLDTSPPGRLPHELSKRTGVDADRIRKMSLSGWSPWFLDSIEPDPQLFMTYTRQFSVLLPPGRLRPREISRWLPWRPSLPRMRACPQCIAETNPPRPYQLLWLLPVTLSCPLHGCLLEARDSQIIDFRDWQRRPPLPRTVAPALLAMDTRTWQALATGKVALQGSDIDAGIWFHLLRTIIDELCANLTEYRNARETVMTAWNEAGLPFRLGLARWHTHEDHEPTTQLLALRAAAAAIHLLETNALTGRGPDAAFFLPCQPPGGADGSPN
ncbi:TniQ family protein [Paenarthrobacter sp. NPDC089989]|uniref:TniQ family protein n=1 Tax=unclassified Paenarthrobacter TaxID=2634190 RepID=UPI00382172B6